jgi:hypothetical protein
MVLEIRVFAIVTTANTLILSLEPLAGELPDLQVQV